jgi:hypothetical protein
MPPVHCHAYVVQKTMTLLQNPNGGGWSIRISGSTVDARLTVVGDQKPSCDRVRDLTYRYRAQRDIVRLLYVV